MAQDALKLVYAASFALHIGGGAVLVAYEEHRPPPPTIVEMRTVERRKAAEPPPPPPPPPQAERAPRAARPAPPAPTAAPPPTPTEAPPADTSAVPDFGLALGGVTGGPGGIAVPIGNGQRAPAPVVRQAAARTLAAAAPTHASGEGDCDEEMVRATLLGSRPQPAYTDEARQAQIEGRVRLELSIDENGHVTAARVLSPLGHGLDEAALASVRDTTFNPATRCGHSVSSTVTMGLTFTLGG